MKTILKWLFVIVGAIVCIVLVSMISGMFCGEIIKNQFVLEARNAYPAGFTDMERNSTGFHLFVKNSVNQSTNNVSGVPAEMQIALHNKITEGTTEQSLTFTVPTRDIALTMPSARMLPEINIAMVPEKKSSYKVFSSIVKKMRVILKSSDSSGVDEQMVSQLLTKSEEKLKISSSIAVTTEISQTFKGKVVWDANTTVAEDGTRVRNISPRGWIVEEEEAPQKPVVSQSTSTKKLGGFVLEQVKEKEFVPAKPMPVVNKEVVTPPVININTEKKVSVAVSTSVVYVANRSLIKLKKMVVVHEVAASYEKEDQVVAPGDILPLKYELFSRLVLRVTVYDGWFIFKKKVVDQTEVFNNGEVWLWYFNGERMVRTKNLSSLPKEYQ